MVREYTIGLDTMRRPRAGFPEGRSEEIRRAEMSAANFVAHGESDGKFEWRSRGEEKLVELSIAEERDKRVGLSFCISEEAQMSNGIGDVGLRAPLVLCFIDIRTAGLLAFSSSLVNFPCQRANTHARAGRTDDSLLLTHESTHDPRGDGACSTARNRLPTQLSFGARVTPGRRGHPRQYRHARQ